MENEIIELLEDLHDTDPCEFDHHGNCQLHGWSGDKPCPQKRLGEILYKIKTDAVRILRSRYAENYPIAGEISPKNNQTKGEQKMLTRTPNEEQGRQLQVSEQMTRLDKEIECFREELQHLINRTQFIRRNETGTGEGEGPPMEQPLCCELAEYLRLKSEQVRAFRENVKFTTSLLEI